MISFMSLQLIKMRGIFPKLSHCAPPLLHGAFNLTNQHLSLILTKPPSFSPRSFLRKNPPLPVSATAAIAADIPPIVSALSLMQMWRELEAESGVFPALHTNISINVEEESESSEKEISGNEQLADFLPSPTAETGGKIVREIEHFILEFEEERRREVAALAERCPVSLFPFRGRIQSLIRLRSLRQAVVTIIHQQWSQKLEAERFETLSNNFILRERLEDKMQFDMDEVPTKKSMIVMEVQPLDSHIFVFAFPFDHLDSENIHFLELVSIREIESSAQDFYSPQAFFSPPLRHKDQQESQSFDASWEERSLLGSSLDWQKASDSHMLQTWHDEIASRGTKTSTDQEQYLVSEKCYWLLQPSNLRRGCG